MFVLARNITEEQAARFGNALAAESAQRAAEYIVHDDLVSLNVVTGSLTRLPGILGVTVYDRNRLPLAQSGQVQPTPGTITVRSLVLTEGREERGSVELIIEPAGASPAMSRLYYALAGWVGFSIVLLLIVARISRNDITEGSMNDGMAPSLPVEPPARLPGNVEQELLPPPPDTRHGAMLRIDVVNQDALGKRLAPHVFAQLLDGYDLLLTNACRLHEGEVMRHIGDECQVFFPESPAQEDQASFRAISCARLFLDVVRETATERKNAGGVALQFTAAIHEDPLLSVADLAIVTGEICRQTGVAGRVMLTEIISENPLVGPRLEMDSVHQQLLQIDVQDNSGETRHQEFRAFCLARLSTPFEEQLAVATQRLCGHSATA